MLKEYLAAGKYLFSSRLPGCLKGWGLAANKSEA